MTSTPARLLELAASTPSSVAFRCKHLGVWEETTYARYAARVAAVGLGLLELGIDAGDRVAILSGNRPEWLITDLAVQGVGALPVYPAVEEPDVAAWLNDAGATMVVAGGDEQLDAILAARDGLTSVKHVLVAEGTSGDGVRALADVEARGAVHSIDEFRARVDARAAAAPEVPAGGPDDEVLSYLPLCHLAERLVCITGALQAGCAVNFGDGGPSFPSDLREVQPTVFFGPPTVWEQLHASTESRMAGATRTKRAAYRWCMKHRRGRVGQLLLYGPLRAKLGMGRVRLALCGGWPLAPATKEWWAKLGIAIEEVGGP